mgnify:CR=1 FL=1
MTTRFWQPYAIRPFEDQSRAPEFCACNTPEMVDGNNVYEYDNDDDDRD